MDALAKGAIPILLRIRCHLAHSGCRHGEAARLLIGRLALLELVPPVLARALEPFPRPVRTLEALHLASADFLRSRGQRLKVATYDERMAGAARSLDFDIYGL